VSRDSSGSIVSDYGLVDRAMGVRSVAGAADFPSNHKQEVLGRTNLPTFPT
jgi:hypothetical protein